MPIRILATLLALALTSTVSLTAPAAETTDYITQIRQHQGKAEAGDANAQFLLAQGYALETESAKPNYSLAHPWYDKAAVQGNAQVQAALGLLYHYGIGAEKDAAKADEWLKKAAAQNNTVAQITLALLAKERLDRNAQQWLEPAVAQGDADATAYLGEFYNAGFVDVQHEKEPFAQMAKELLKKAATQEKPSAYAMYRLASFYRYEEKTKPRRWNGTKKPAMPEKAKPPTSWPKPTVRDVSVCSATPPKPMNSSTNPLRRVPKMAQIC